jgi:hypothetical protein
MGSGPRSFNIVSFIMLLAMAAAGYGVWKFFPVYFTAWQVDRVLSDGASQSYKINRMREPLQSKSKADLIEIIRRKVVALGVTDPDMTVSVDFDGTQANAVCDYTVVVNHPFGDKVTVLPMHRTATTDLKRVDWDN